MANILLFCNVINCRRKLNKEVCVTSCSHIFCREHMQSMISNVNDIKCLACDTQLTDDFGYAERNLNPTEQYKTLILSGLNPDQIMDIATRAISFFVYQMNYENKNKENILRHRKEQFEELKHYCQSLTNKYKADLQKLRRNIEGLKNELVDKMKETEKQQQFIEQSRRENKKLQAQLECFKREVMMTKNILPQTDNFPYMTPTSCISNNSHGLPRFSDPSNKKHFRFGNPAKYESPFDLHNRR